MTYEVLKLRKSAIKHKPVLKTTNKHCIVASIFMLTMTLFGTGKGQVKNQKEEARLFVQKFYDWYNKLYCDEDFYNKNHQSVYDYVFKKKSQYFDQMLLETYLAYDKVEPEKADEIVGLDFDPIVAAQDDGFDYQTGLVKQVGKEFFVNIHCGSKGKSRSSTLKEQIAIVAELRNENGSWKFVNFQYPPPINGKVSDLITILNGCKKEAEEYNSTHKTKAHKN